MNRYWIRGARGDTLVEVLIALAIISLVLAIAYGATSRSTLSLQDTQEHRDASVIAQTQLEFLRASANLDTTTEGCYDDSGVPTARSSATCRFGSGGSVSACNDTAACFLVDITKDSTYVYKVDVTWEGLRGKGNTVTLWYKLPPPIIATGHASPSPSPSPAPGGNAAIGSESLPCAPNCAYVPPPTGHYQFSRRLINLSKNDPANVKSCKWDWGDGNVDSYPGTSAACAEGSYSENHQYAPPANLPPYPAACYAQPGANAYRPVYTVRLIVDLYSGGQRTDSYTFGLPDCVP